MLALQKWAKNINSHCPALVWRFGPVGFAFVDNLTMCQKEPEVHTQFPPIQAINQIEIALGRKGSSQVKTQAEGDFF